MHIIIIARNRMYNATPTPYDAYAPTLHAACVRSILNERGEEESYNKYTQLRKINVLY